MPSFLKHTLFIFCISSSIFGKDLGIYGHTFVPEEEDFLAYLKNKFNTLSEQERDQIQQQLQKHYKNQLLEPSPVENIQEATTFREFYFDPSITVKNDIRDHQGKVIIPAGASFNPLEETRYKTALLFFDGSKESHISWAKKESPSSKWILIRGKPLALEASENRPVYFDQKGVLSHWLKIEKVPARVTQVETKLRVEEIPIKETECEISS